VTNGSYHMQTELKCILKFGDNFMQFGLLGKQTDDFHKLNQSSVINLKTKRA